MTLELCFWILMLVWLVFGVGAVWSTEGRPWSAWAGTLLPWFLFLLLGWKVFGPPLHG